MASAKRKKAAPKSKDAALIRSLRKGINSLSTRLTGIEYLANHLLDKYVSILTPEEAEAVAVAIVIGAEPQHRIMLTEFIGRSSGYAVPARKMRKDQRLQ